FYAFRKLRNLRIDHRVVCKRNYPIESATDGGAGDKNLLQPSSLPRLQNLALVNMPTTTDDAELVSSFKNFLESLSSPPALAPPPHATELQTVMLELTNSDSTDIGMYCMAA